MADGSLLVDDEGYALCHAEKAERAVKFRHGFLRVAKQRKTRADLLRKAFVLFPAVHADAQDLRLGFFKQGETILVRLHLVRSGGCVGEDVERQDDVLQTAVLAQLDGMAVVIGKLEIRSEIADLQRRHD